MKHYLKPSLSTTHLEKLFVRTQATGTISLNPQVDGGVNNVGGPTDLGTDFSVGDFANNSTDRGFIGFDISGITGNVQSAILTINQSSVLGTPYVDLGSLVVDHVDFGGSLDAGDFNGGTLASNIGTISGDAGTGLKTLDVTSFVQADISAARTTSQFRLRFSSLTDGNNDLDAAVIDSVETGVSPELTITLE